MISLEELEAKIEDLRAQLHRVSKGDEMKMKAAGFRLGSMRVYEGVVGTLRSSGRIACRYGTATLADPGDAGAIPVTLSGYVPLVTGGAETRTLADADAPGLTLDLYLKTDGGDCVVTAASPVNQTGNNTLTFDNAGEHIRISSIEDGSDYEWRVVANDGVGLTTV